MRDLEILEQNQFKLTTSNSVQNSIQPHFQDSIMRTFDETVKQGTGGFEKLSKR